MNTPFKPMSYVRETNVGERSMKRSLVRNAAGIGAFLVAVASPVLAQTTGAAVCVACHGAHGEGGGGAPRLAGQDVVYLGHALSMFKAGTRASPIMQPMAAGLDDAEIARLAEYFSKQEAAPVDAGASQPADRIAAGKRLAESGASNAAACFSCHGAEGLGNGSRFPSIAAQPAQFVVDRLHEFQARAKAAAPQPGTMTAVAATLDESQIAQAAAYLSRLER